MKTLSKAELKAKAAKIFGENTGSVIYAVSDGQMFFNKNRAELDANSGKEKLAVYDFARQDVEDSKSTTKEDDGHSVDELKELVAQTSDFAQLDKLLEDEKAGKNRKTAIAAIEARIKELKEAEDQDKTDK